MAEPRASLPMPNEVFAVESVVVVVTCPRSRADIRKDKSGAVMNMVPCVPVPTPPLDRDLQDRVDAVASVLGTDNEQGHVWLGTAQTAQYLSLPFTTIWQAPALQPSFWT